MSIETKVFSLLAGLSSKVAIDAVYYLLRLIRHRGVFTDGINSLIIRGLSNEPSVEGEKLTFNLLHEIEATENKKVTDLSTDEIQRLVSIMDKIVTEKHKEDLHLNETKGRSLLAEMREIDTNSNRGNN